MKKLLLLIIPLLAIMVFVAQIDDNLSSDASNLIKRIETSGKSESYLYLVGIYANEKENPEDVGRRILEEYRKLEDDDLHEILEHQDLEYQETRKISLPEGKLFCRAWEDGCLETLFSAELDIAKLYKEHEALLTRSNIFHEFKEYRTLTKPSISEQFSPYQYIAAAGRIKVLSAISIYKNGNSKEAIAALLNQFSEIRSSLELQDNLIGKLVFLMKLSEIIDVSSIILSKTQFKNNNVRVLSHAERDFGMVAAREFGMSYYTFTELDKHPEFFEIGGNFPGWMTRMVYKPNMTINSITPIYYRLERLAQLSPSEFAHEIENGRDINLSTSRVRNYVGIALIASSPNFDEYVARFIDFDTKLLLFNHRYHLQRDFSTARNPYYENEAPEISKDRVCFRGPLEDKRFLRCMRTKI